MAFPSVRSFAETSWATAVGNLTMPATVVAGDLLVACIMIDGASTQSWDNTTLGTWTALVWQNRSGSTPTLGVYVKIADGTEDGLTIDLSAHSLERGMGCVFAVQDWYGTVSGGVESADTSGSGTAADPPSLSPSWGSDDNLWLALAAFDGSGTASAYPSSYADNQHTGTAGGGSGGGYATASRENATATEDPSAFTNTSEEWCVATVAIRAAASPSIAHFRRLVGFSYG